MNEDVRLFTAPLIRRLIAFVIDAVAAFFPAFAITLIVLQTPISPHLLAPVLYVAPIEGTITLIDLPLEVNQMLNDSLPDVVDYGATEIRNVSTMSTFLRILSVFSVLFYIGYGTVATLLFDGITAGKYCMGIQTIYVRGGKPTVGILLRELLGKVVLNSLGLFVVSIITMIVTPKHYAVHDFIGGTRVVYKTSYGGTLPAESEEDEEDDEDTENDEE